MERTLTLAERLVRSTVRIDCFSNHQYVSGGTGFLLIHQSKGQTKEGYFWLATGTFFVLLKLIIFVCF